MTAIHDMSVQRLRAELVIAERLLHSHREGVHGSCYQRCEDSYPCEVTLKASGTIRAVSEALVARSERIERETAPWR